MIASSSGQPPTNTPLIGVAVMVLAMVLLPVGDAIAKHLTAFTLYTGAALAWSRFVVGAVLVVPVAWSIGAFRGLGWGFVGRQTLRGGLVGGAITCMVEAVATIPLADAYGTFFIGPALAAVLGVLLLKERTAWADWAAVALGFLGVLLVVRPSATMEVGTLWALAAGTCFGCFLVATRWSAGTAPPIAQLSGQFVAGLVLLAPLGLPGFLLHGIEGAGWILLMGVTSGAANLFQILAFRHAGAAYLAPIVYVQIIAATALSWAVLGDRPATLALVGLAIIVSAALFKVPWRRMI